jgi:hypothetical protein
MAEGMRRLKERPARWGVEVDRAVQAMSEEGITQIEREVFSRARRAEEEIN